MIRINHSGLSNLDSNYSLSSLPRNYGDSNIVYNHESFPARHTENYGRKILYQRDDTAENSRSEENAEETSRYDHLVKEELRDSEYIDVNNYFKRRQERYDAIMSRPFNTKEIVDVPMHANKNLSPNADGDKKCDILIKPVESSDEHEDRSDSPRTMNRSTPQLFRPYQINQLCPNVKVLKPDEINGHVQDNTSEHTGKKEEYHILKQQLSSEPSLDRLPGLTMIPRAPIEHNGTNISEYSILFLQPFNVDSSSHPYKITKELVDDFGDEYSLEDLTLRYHVIVFLWVLLGERRLMRTGYPSEGIHLVLWRVVHVCCSVAGVKSAAAVPLPESHNCGTDMLCFRDHVHRFLEVCAPTRDLWKQFGWASLTVEAVMRKIYKEELLSTLLKHMAAIPMPIKMAMRKLATLEREDNERQYGVAETIRNTLKWQKISRLANQTTNKSNLPVPYFRPILPKPPEKKKRGRPVKIKKNLPETGRIQRVMLWRFIMNLLEEPGNAACIHWVKREDGIFRILNTDWLARIWGRRHGNPRMTYEKMARAMRTYYRSKVLQPVPRTRNLPRKLVYKFNPALIKKMPTTK